MAMAQRPFAVLQPVQVFDEQIGARFQAFAECLHTPAGDWINLPPVGCETRALADRFGHGLNGDHAGLGHSYLHSWSPDGKKIIFTGQRNEQWNIWEIDVKTKEERPLTTTPTLDDGSEYSPDGKYIYFNSVRTGTMQIWRMKADGSEPTQLTFDEYNDWFPHISPDGKWMVYLSFPKEIDPTSHPFYKRVYLRIMPVSGGVPKTIAYIYGGQGTINVPSWSPDSKQVAFISNTK
jgi:Tol biopolymer transport system component